jgi:lipopolysaccharide transport system ATP-binding protein
MSQVVIRARGLGKRYRIGGVRASGIGEELAAGAKNVWGRMRAAPTLHSEALHFWALRDITFEIRAGEVIGFIGPNGAGKSTLLKILARITAPTEGYAELVGRWGALLEVGTGFNQELTGRENVYLSGAILGMTKAEIDRKFDETVAFSELENFLDTPIKRYSSGMGVRLGFAVAAHLEPEILLVDEVLAVGDLAFQQKCLGKLDQVAQQGRTVIYVSHKMESIKTLCQKVFWLEAGQVRMLGEATEVVNAYEAQSFARAMSMRNGGQRSFVAREAGIELSEVSYLTTEGETTANLVVRLRGHADSQVRRLKLNLTLSTLEGVLISAVRPKQAHAYLEVVSGDWECTFEFPEITRYLNHGDYFIGVTIKRPNFQQGLRVPQAVVVQVPNVNRNGREHGVVTARGLVPLPVTFHGGNGADNTGQWVDEAE